MLAFAFCQRGQRSLGQGGERGGILQAIDGQPKNCEPLLNGFKRLHTEVLKIKDFFRLKLIDGERFPNYNLVGQNKINSWSSGLYTKVFKESEPSVG